MRIGIVLFLFFAISCIDRPNATLAGLPELVVEVGANREIDRDTDDCAPAEITAYIYYDEEAFKAAHDGGCATLDDIEATFNGVRLDFETRGGNYSDLDGCRFPTLRGHLELGTADPGSLRMSDGSKMIIADFGPGAVSPRIATPVSPMSWTFARTERVTLAWSHPADLARASPEEILIAVVVEGIVKYSSDSEDFMITKTDTEIMFMIPSGSSIIGDGALDIIVGEAGAAFDVGMATTCSGAIRCFSSSIRGTKHAVTFR